MTTKVLVRYVGGSSGRFISLLLQSFTLPVKLVKPNFAHYNSEIFRNHNMTRINTGSDIYVYGGFNINPSIQDYAVNWWGENLKFNPTDEPLIVLDSHIPNPLYLLKAHTDVKLVNIVFDDNDVDQICYNFITKLGSDVNFNIGDMVDLFSKLLSLKEPVDKSDIKLACWLYKYSSEQYNINQRFNYISNTISNDHININFSDITNKNIINKLDEIADFIGISLPNDRRENAKELVETYTNAQVTVPWPLLRNDYDLK
jgi:hypothetical protein